MVSNQLLDQGLIEMKDSEIIKWAEERHIHFCLRAKSFMDCLGKEFNSPKFAIYSKNARVAAWARYGSRICEYNLAYMLTAKELYDRTFAHEVAHFVVGGLDIRAQSHGDLFKWVFKELFGERGKTKHHYYLTDDSVRTGKLMVNLYYISKEIRRDAASIAE